MPSPTAPVPIRRRGLLSLLRSMGERLRCAWYTGLTHELDFHTGSCRFCGVEWTKVYPPPQGTKTETEGNPRA